MDVYLHEVDLSDENEAKVVVIAPNVSNWRRRLLDLSVKYLMDIDYLIITITKQSSSVFLIISVWKLGRT